MEWTEDGYLTVVFGRLGLKFNDGGWPREIPFTNLSELGGGVAPLRRLLALWKSGALKIVRVEPEDLERAARDPRSVLPNPGTFHAVHPADSATHTPRIIPRVLHPIDLHDMSHSSLSIAAPSPAVHITCKPEKRPRKERCDKNGVHRRPVTGKRPRPCLRGVRSTQYVYEAESDADCAGTVEGRGTKRLRVALSDEYVEEVFETKSL